MSKKILVVDDDPEIVQLLTYNLCAAGFIVSSASNGFQAIKLVALVHPDLIVLDLMMPELDGFAVCEILRRKAASASIPIVMLTALSSQMARLSGFDAGATEFLVKPFSPKSLVDKVIALTGLANDQAEPTIQGELQPGKATLRDHQS